MQKLSIFDDEEFQNQDLETKNKYLDKYFETDLIDDEFLALPQETQDKYKQAFRDSQLDFDISDTYDKHIAPVFDGNEEETSKEIEQTPADIAATLTPNKNQENLTVAPIQDVDIPTLEEKNSNIIDQVQSSLVKQSRESARAVSKFAKRGFESLDATSAANAINVPESLTQEQADKIVGYSKENRTADTKAMQTIKDDWDNNNFGAAIVGAVQELPAVLADSSGEIAQLMNLPSTIVAISARVSKFEDEYKKNNDNKNPDAAWYAEAITTQSALLLAERLGIKILGKTMKSTKPKTYTGVGAGVVGGGAFEAGQEYGESISETHLTQKDGDKTLGEIATSDDAKFGAFMGGIAGTALKGGAEAVSTVRGKYDKGNQIGEALQREVDNWDLIADDGIYTGAKNRGTQSDLAKVIHPNGGDLNKAVENWDIEKVEVAPEPFDDVVKGFEQLEEELNQDSTEELTPKGYEANEETITPDTITPDVETPTNQDTEIQVQETPQENRKIRRELFDTQEQLDALVKDIEKYGIAGASTNSSNLIKKIKETFPGETKIIESLNNNTESILFEEISNLQDNIYSSLNNTTTNQDTEVEAKLNDVPDIDVGDIPTKASDAQIVNNEPQDTLSVTDDTQTKTKPLNLFENDSPDLQADNIKDTQIGKEVIYTANDISSTVTIADKQTSTNRLVTLEDEKGNTFSVNVKKLDYPKIEAKEETVEKEPQNTRVDTTPEFEAAFKEKYNKEYTKLFEEDKQDLEMEKLKISKEQKEELVKDGVDFDTAFEDYYNGYAYISPAGFDGYYQSNKWVLKKNKEAEPLIDKVFEETATTEDIKELDTIIEEEIKNEPNTTKTEDRSIQDIQTTKTEEPITQSNNDTIKENVSPAETANQTSIKFDTEKEYSTKGIMNEYPNREIAKKIQKDVAKYVGQLAKNLGYEFNTDLKGKKLTWNGVQSNIPPSGGEASFYLWKPNSKFGVYVSLPYRPDYLDNGYENYKLQKLMATADQEFLFRVENKDGKSYNNQWVKKSDLKNQSFVDRIKVLVNKEEERSTQKDKVTVEENAVPAIQDTIKELNEKFEDNPNNDTIENKEEVKDDANTNTRADTGTKENVRADGTNTDGRSSTAGNGSNEQKENTTKTPNEPSNSNDRNDDTTDGTRLQQDRSKGDSNSTVHSGDVAVVKENPFTLNQETIYKGGEVGRYNANIKAIKLLKENKSHYTNEEKNILSSYTGWGGLQKAFKDSKGNFKKGWDVKGKELETILTYDELNAARRGVLDAYFTPLSLVKSMWDISSKLGIKGGVVLEPSMGTGRFIGMIPNNLKNKTAFNGVELDSTTYKIAKALYGNINARNKGFETTNYKSNHDLVIGNPPYGSFKLYDKNNKQYNSLTAHNYFVVKSLDALKDGGILNFVISSSFMDNLDAKTTKLINSKAKMIGAIRLPSDAFKDAGTSVTTDIILFQKIADNEKGNSEVWSKKSKLHDLKINQYFIDNPDMLLGDWVKGYRGAGELKNNGNFDENLKNAISKLPDNIVTTDGTIQENDKLNPDNQVTPSTMYVKDGVVYINIKDGESVKPELAKVALKKAEDFISLRDNLLKLISMQLDEKLTDEQIENQRSITNKSYDTFVKKHKALNTTANKSFITKDKDGFLVTTLEENYQAPIKADNKRGLTPQKESFTKADILTKRTITPVRDIKTKDSKEALKLSLNIKGGIDLEYMSKISDKSQETLLSELKKEIFYDVDAGYVTRDIYLSGDVKTKYTNAVNEYAKDELKKVIPADKEAKDIRAEIGQKWIGSEYVTQFIQEVLGYRSGKATISNATSTWFVSAEYSNSFPFSASGTKDKTIIEAALNNKQIKIYHPRDKSGRSTLDTESTDLANAQVESLKEKFEEWIYQDKPRRDILVARYNELKNRFAPAQDEDAVSNYEIPNLKFYVPRLHQRKAVYKATYGNTPLLLNHTVGSGKTLTSQMIAMEWRRLGKSKKPLIATLKAVVPQYAKEFKEAYPNAKILVPTATDFHKDKRKRLLSSIATGDYDAIIISHEQLKAIENPTELQNQLIEDELFSYQQALDEIEDSYENKRTIRDIENAMEKLEVKFKALTDTMKDDILSFDKLGIDGLIIDESHQFKKLAYSTTMGQIKGMPETGGSQRAFDLFVKTQHIMNQNANKNVVFMTGTPITNSLPELFLIQKFLQNDILQEQGINNFDSWAKDYVEQNTDIELTATGGLKEVTRIKEFKNLPTLIETTNQFIDTVTNADIKKNDKNFKLPPLKNKQPTEVYSEASEDQKEFNESLIKRIANFKKDNPDNHLAVFGDGAKMALDMRLISDKYEDNPNSKVNKAVDKVWEKYLEFKDVNGTQLIFSDKGVPKAGGKAKRDLEILIKKAEDGDMDASKALATYNDSEIDDILNGTQFSVYEDIKTKLIKKGLKDSEVVFIHDYETKEKKLELSKKVNAGEVKVVIGSTKKLGTGMNVQQRLTAVHHLDVPYTPAEIEQRNGRIIRQGNKLISEVPNFEVEIVHYMTKQTLDGMNYQILQNKSLFIEQFYSGIIDENIDIEEPSNNEIAERIKAEASGNPLLIDKIKIEKKLKKLRRFKRSFELSKAETADKIKELKRFLNTVDLDIEMLESDVKTIAENAIKINKKTVEKDTEIGEAIYDEVVKIKNKGLEEKTIGTIGSIDLDIYYNKKTDEVTINFRTEYPTSLTYDFINQPLKGLGTKVKNRLKTYTDMLEGLKLRKPQSTEDIKRLSKSKDSDFTKQSELDGLEKDLKKINDSIFESADKEQNAPAAEETNSYMQVPSNKNGTKIESKTYNDKETQKLYSQTGDTAGVNYVETYGQSGLPVRPESGTINIAGKTITLPTLKEPINTDTVRVYLSDIIGNRLYESKIKNKSALGVYQKNDTAIRVKNHSDVEIMAHELAHYLDFFYKNSTKKAVNSFFRKEIMKNKNEVKSVSYTTNPKLELSEGFAEFVRLWLTNHNTVSQIAPGMVKDFEAKLKTDKKLFEKMTTLQEGMHKFYYQGSEAILRSRRGGELDTTAKKIKRSQKEIGKELRQKAIDKIHTIKRIEANIKGEIENDAIDSPYKLLQMVNGHSSIMYSTMNFGVPTVKTNGDITYSGKSLNSIFEPATKVSEERVRLLEDYLVSKRAAELKEQGRENLISTSEIEAGLDLVNTYPEFETIFNEYQEFNNSMLDFYVDMNLITTSQRESFQEFNKNYVPFHRITESVQYGEVPAAKIGQRLTGGTHSLGNIMENIIDGVESNIKEALISRGKSVFYKMLEDSGSGGVYATKVSTENKLVKADLEAQAKNIAKVMAQLGVTVSKNGMIVSGDISSDLIIDTEDIEINLLANPDVMEFWTHGHKPTSNTGYIDSAIINDKVVYFETNDIGLVDAMTSFRSSHYNDVVQGLMKIKNIMTWNITNNPLFYLANFARDTVSASVLSKNNFLPVLSSMKGMYHFITKSNTFKEFMASGAGYGTMRTNLGSDVEAMQMLKVNRGLDLAGRLISAFEYGADVFEYGTRVGDFALAKKENKSNAQAAFEAREVSTDFAIKGSSKGFTGFLATVPFMKAAINGIDKTVRRIFTLNGEMKISNMVKFRNSNEELLKHKIKLYATGGMLTLGTMALFMQNRDDERYKNLTKDQKLMYWNVFLEDGTHIKIPRPYDIGFVFSGIPEIMMNYVYTKHGEDALKDFAWTLKTMFNIGDVPGLINPILQDMTNKNWRGSPIVPSYLENLDDKSEQYLESTPLVYKELGKATGASPIKMQHYIDGYLGLTAKMMEEATENLLWNKKDWGDRPFAKDPLEFMTYRFKGKEVEPRTIWSEKYYELVKKSNSVKNSFNSKKKKAYKDGGADVKEYISDKQNQAYVHISKVLRKYNQHLADIKVQSEHIYYDKKLTKKMKEKKINDFYKLKTKTFEKIVTDVNEKIKSLEDK